MKSRAARDIVVGLDAGTSAVKVVVAERNGSSELTVVGMGIADAGGMRRGTVVHPDAAAASIKQAVAEAELTAGVTVEAVDVALSGAHIQSVNSRAIVAVAGRERQITAADAQRAVDAAAAVALPDGRQILYVIPQEFVVDEQDGVIDPIGMVGARLEVNLHVITGSPSSTQNLLACVMRCGMAIGGTVVGHVATAESVLTRDERVLGVAVIDIGGGTTSVAIFDRGALCHTAVVPIGGDHLTSDLAVGLRTPLAEAERLKRRYARTFALSIDEHETVPVVGIAAASSRDVPRRVVTDIVAGWTQALLERVKDEIRAAGYAKALTAGVVLTGGGAGLRGLPDTAHAMFAVPVRRASPNAFGCVADLVNVPAFATAVGLVQYTSGLKPPATAHPVARAGGLRSLLRAFY